MTAFYIKRPGQREGEPIGVPDEYDVYGETDAEVDEWALYLPHQCNAWDVGYGTLEETLAEAREFRAGLDKAIKRLEQEETR